MQKSRDGVNSGFIRSTEKAQKLQQWKGVLPANRLNEHSQTISCAQYYVPEQHPNTTEEKMTKKLNPLDCISAQMTAVLLLDFWQVLSFFA